MCMYLAFWAIVCAPPFFRMRKACLFLCMYVCVCLHAPRVGLCTGAPSPTGTPWKAVLEDHRHTQPHHPFWQAYRPNSKSPVLSFAVCSRACMDLCQISTTRRCIDDALAGTRSMQSATNTERDLQAVDCVVSAEQRAQLCPVDGYVRTQARRESHGLPKRWTGLLPLVS